MIQEVELRQLRCLELRPNNGMLLHWNIVGTEKACNIREYVSLGVIEATVVFVAYRATSMFEEWCSGLR